MGLWYLREAKTQCRETCICEQFSWQCAIWSMCPCLLWGYGNGLFCWVWHVFILDNSIVLIVNLLLLPAFELFCYCFFKQNIFALKDSPHYKPIWSALEPVGCVVCVLLARSSPNSGFCGTKLETIPATPQAFFKLFSDAYSNKTKILFLNCILLLSMKWEIVCFMGGTISL